MKPRPARRAPLRSLTFALLFATLPSACGLRTAVRPPEDTAPVIPGTATVTREADVPVVRWKRAVRSADGMRLDDLAAFVVERKKSGEESWERLATVDVVDQEKIRRRDSFSWRDPEESAADASYRVIAVTADGEEGPPNEAVVAAAPVAPIERAAGTSPASESGSVLPATPAP